MYFEPIKLAFFVISIFTTAFVATSQAETVHYKSNKSSITCNVNSIYTDEFAKQSKSQRFDKNFPSSLKYLNEEVMKTYNMMRSKVINHVKKEVLLSLLGFNINSLSPNNIAAYVSEATQPFLPFTFANGVKIIAITHKQGTIIYKTETPLHKNHNHTPLLTKAGIASATSTVCNDGELVEELLERNIVIQYDYYDPNGVFICSFNIKDGQFQEITK